MRKALCVITALVAALTLSGSALATVLPFHWPKYMPAPNNERFVIVQQNDIYMPTALTSAVNSWNPSAYIQFSIQNGFANCNPVSNVAKTCVTGIDGVGGTLAKTSIYALNTKWYHITQTVTMWDVADVGASHTAAWKQAVACHELGHVAGLYAGNGGPPNYDERLTGNSCTYKSITTDPPTAPSATVPDTADFNLLTSKYTHLDNFNDPRPNLDKAPKGKVVKVATLSTGSLGPAFAPLLLEGVALTG